MSGKQSETSLKEAKSFYVDDVAPNSRKVRCLSKKVFWGPEVDGIASNLSRQNVSKRRLRILLAFLGNLKREILVDGLKHSRHGTTKIEKEWEKFRQGNTRNFAPIIEQIDPYFEIVKGAQNQLEEFIGFDEFVQSVFVCFLGQQGSRQKGARDDRRARGIKSQVRRF